MDITIKLETRLCTVEGKLGYFHRWEQYSDVLAPSPMIGGHSGGNVSRVLGIVEFSDGVQRVEPYSIKFCDEQNEYLKEMKKQTSKNEAIRSEIEKAYNAFVALRDKYEWETSLDMDEIIGVLGEELAK